MQFLPKTVHFFHLFEDLAALAKKTAQVLSALKLDKTLKTNVKKAAKLEEAADEICHEIYYQSSKAFVTPIDREDIQLLAKTLDNTVDLIENAVSNLYLYQVGKLTPEYKEFCTLISESVREVAELISLLKYKGKHLAKMKKLVIKIHSVENEGDDLMRRALKKLFTQQRASLEVIKWKDLYENLELVLDECEDVADVVETVIIKNF